MGRRVPVIWGSRTHCELLLCVYWLSCLGDIGLDLLAETAYRSSTSSHHTNFFCLFFFFKSVFKVLRAMPYGRPYM